MTFKENLSKFLTDDEISSLLDSFLNEDKHAAILNIDKISDEEFLELYPNVIPHPLVEHAYLFDKNEYQLGKSLYHDLGCFYIQEPSAMSVASFLPKINNAFILDMCAAPGGKSIQTAFRNPTSTIISNDLSKPRTSLLLSNIERLGISNVVITNNDFASVYKSYLESFDTIILDAPCSGSGMFRKDDKMIEDWSINKVYKFAELQKELLSIAYEMLKPGGVISYSTCSYSMEEDEEVIQDLLDKHKDAVILPLENIKGIYKNKKCPLGIRFMPNMFPGEGQYLCLIKKPGELKPNNFVSDNKFQKTFPFIGEGTNVKKYGDFYFALNHDIPIRNLNVIRYGVKLAEYDGKVYRYDLHLARSELSKNMNTVELTLDEVKTYLSGNVIRKVSDFKGYILLTYKNKTIDIAKTDGFVIKNHYPKGLRRN